MALHKRMLLLVQLSLASALLLATSTTLLPDCKESCGDIPIPYPFGLTDGCYLHVPGQDSQQFKLACNTTTTPPSIQFLDSDNFPSTISNIFTGESAMQVMMITSRNCYNDTTYLPEMDREPELFLPHSYTLADSNKIYNIGCNKATKLFGYPLRVTDPDQLFEVVLSGVSLCQDEFGKRFPETCSGFGCSVNSIPSGLQNVTLGVWTLGTGLGTSRPWGLSYPCSYGFVVDERNFTFAGNRSFDELNGKTHELPVLASWAIGDDNCEEAKKKKNETAFACNGVNTECVDRDPGYFCKCLDGYDGNPYLLNDCSDVDECKNNSTLCSGPATCVNSVGSYKCKCHSGYRNDDNDRNKCVKINETSSKNGTEMKVALGVCLSFLVLLSIAFVVYHILKKKKFQKLLEKHAKDNGGPLILQELKKYEALGFKEPRTFKLEELTKATNNFHDKTNRIGQGSFGKVYQGRIFPEDKMVAIKKSKGEAPTMSDASRQAHAKQFINEMILLNGISHNNVVKLLGFCVENDTPILVYELVSNGTLHRHIHDPKKKRKNGGEPLSFLQRIKIVTEAAEALAYLHCKAFTKPILHRDVKTSNILLDEKFTAKVSDFGASKLIPEDPNNQTPTLVQGTPGYVDPEFYQTHQLTQKSDVYSFGVVLLEMLTSQTATSSNYNPDDETDQLNLASHFLKIVEENRLDEILDHEIIDKENYKIAEQVGQLAESCLSLKGRDRPTMEEVEAQLKAILAVIMPKHPGGGKPKDSHKETDYLLAASPSNAFVVDIRSDEGEAIGSINYDKSMHNQAHMMKPNDGR